MGKNCGASRKMAMTKGYADGGVVSPWSIKGVINNVKKMVEPENEDIRAKFARKDAELKAKHPELSQPKQEPAKPAPRPNAAEALAGRGAQIEKAVNGYKDGGQIKAGIIRGKGTGTSDSIKGKMPVGSFVMPADSTDVMVSNGETHFTPEMVQNIGAAALMAAKGMTHTPVDKQVPNDGMRHFFEGGINEEKKKNSFGDAAAANQNPLVSQIPTGGNINPAPQGNPVTGTEFTRNVANTISALPGAAPILSGANALMAASQTGQAATTGAAGIANLAQKVAPYAVPTAGLYGISQAAESPQAPAQPMATASPVATNNIAAKAINTPTTPANAPAPAVASTAPQQITRVGNSYTGEPNIAGNVTINNPRGDGISAQNNQAAQALSDKSAAAVQMSAPVQGGGVNLGDGSGRRMPGFQERLDRKNAETGASSIMDSESRRTARNALKRMDAQDLAGINNDSAQTIANTQAETQRQGYGIQAQNNLATQQNAAARLGIDRTNATLNNQQTTQKMAADKQMQDLRQSYITAKPEERAAIAEKLAAIQDNYPKAVQDEYSHFTNEGVDGKTGVIYNKRTGQIAGQNQASPPPNHIDALKKDPKLAANFDAIYGAGASSKHLGNK